MELKKPDIIPTYSVLYCTGRVGKYGTSSVDDCFHHKPQAKVTEYTGSWLIALATGLRLRH